MHAYGTRICNTLLVRLHSSVGNKRRFVRVAKCDIFGNESYESEKAWTTWLNGWNKEVIQLI